MKRLVAILQAIGLLPDPLRTLSEQGVVAGIREVLGGRCPLCGGELSGHRYGVVASYKVDGVVCANRQEARAKLLSGRDDLLGAASANDPTVDLVYYALLECSTLHEAAVIEHYSGADLYSEESAVMLSGITAGTIERLMPRVSEWMFLSSGRESRP